MIQTTVKTNTPLKWTKSRRLLIVIITLFIAPLKTTGAANVLDVENIKIDKNK